MSCEQSERSLQPPAPVCQRRKHGKSETSKWKAAVTIRERLVSVMAKQNGVNTPACPNYDHLCLITVLNRERVLIPHEAASKTALPRNKIFSKNREQTSCNQKVVCVAVCCRFFCPVLHFLPRDSTDACRGLTPSRRDSVGGSVRPAPLIDDPRDDSGSSTLFN